MKTIQNFPDVIGVTLLTTDKQKIQTQYNNNSRVQ